MRSWPAEKSTPAQRQSTRAWVDFDEGKNQVTQRNPVSYWDWLSPPTMILEVKGMIASLTHEKKYSTGYSQMAQQPYINPKRISSF